MRLETSPQSHAPALSIAKVLPRLIGRELYTRILGHLGNPQPSHGHRIPFA